MGKGGNPPRQRRRQPAQGEQLQTAVPRRTSGDARHMSFCLKVREKPGTAEKACRFAHRKGACGRSLVYGQPDCIRGRFFNTWARCVRTAHSYQPSTPAQITAAAGVSI